MPVKKLITLFFLIVLVIGTVIFAVSAMFYRHLDSFISEVLTYEIEIARTYEKIAATVLQTSEYKAENLLDPFREESLVPDEIPEKLHTLLARLEPLVERAGEAEHKARFIEVKGHVASYLKLTDEFERTVAIRGQLYRKAAARKSEVGETVSSEVRNLLDQFKRMAEDFSKALKDPDFRSSLGTTSSLMEMISRIEKDLLIAQSEVALYLSQSTLVDQNRNERSDQKVVAERVQERLQAITSLLKRSGVEATSIIQKRVLNNVHQRISEFRNSFQKLRGVLERPDSGRLEIDDLVSQKSYKLIEVRKAATSLAAAEAERFWNQLFATSGKLLADSKKGFSFSLAVLLIGAVSGTIVAIFLPDKIAAPFVHLKNQIKSFKLGSTFQTHLDSSMIEEVNHLAKAFRNMCERLNDQAEVIKNNLSSIQRLSKAYWELQRNTGDNRSRMDKPVNIILSDLMKNNTGVDISKVMILKRGSSEGERFFFSRLGDPQFSQNFVESEEYLPYCRSLGWSEEMGLDYPEEIIPYDEGLTGWYFENNLGVRSGAEEIEFFLPAYPLVSVAKIPVLHNRTFEKGLSGCLLTEPIYNPGFTDTGTPFESPEVLGLVFVYFCDPSTRLSWQEISFIQILASQIGAIIETDTLLEESTKRQKLELQLTLSEQIRDNLLPQSVPHFEGLHISRVCLPAEDVGGDYYDFFPLGPELIGIVIADASGKNVSAAIIMSVLKTTLSTMELSTMSPSAVMTKANHIIEKNITNDRFITAMYVIINTGTGEVTLSSAGHSPALLVSGKGLELSLLEKTTWPTAWNSGV